MGALYFGEMLASVGNLVALSLIVITFLLLWGLCSVIVFGFFYHSPVMFIKCAEIHKEEGNLIGHFLKDTAKMFLYGPFGFSKKYRRKICPKCFG